MFYTPIKRSYLR